ncbi:MAG: bifunctional alpha,alpha-trehalose-phosphate synthase (UDP-forming)/trehalose-phosphatase [Archangium sp.]|nr:bifunctional alpha,alpha-trehalose-phosphate synthase (UDP-forming)/trehalose-phosphatase [Archangium sp.]
MQSRLLLVSNRLPVTLTAGEGGLHVQQSVGGLATALLSVHGASESRWIGWPGLVTDVSGAEVLAALAPHRAVPVPLSAAEVKAYYDGYCNGVLWPLCHYLLDKVRLDQRDEWAAYRAVNERFADAVAAQWKPGDLVWVHDYHLALVPALVRQRCPGARIGFFLHVPFPGPEVFRILPRRAEVLRGILGADVVGFHTASYAYSFAYACSQVLGLELSGDVLTDDGRPVRVGAFPIGIDADAFAARAATPEVRARAEALRLDSQGRKLLLSVDRFDYTKGHVHRLLALERLLQLRPELKDQLHVIQLMVPTREQVDAYADYRSTVNELAGRINGTFGSPTHTLVHLLHRSVEPDELSALYAAADVMLVTPLRDGMNLVAKEYVASRIDDAGVLVLSEFAGAATELHEAVQVNPYDLDALAGAMSRAIDMPVFEQRLAMVALRKTVHAGGVAGWAAGFIEALEQSPEATQGAPSIALEQAMAIVTAAPRLVLVLDYDGTLVEFSPSPRTATPDKALLELLTRLSQRPGTSVHVVSGRSRESLEAFFGELELGLHGEHGLWSRPDRKAEWRSRSPVPPTWLEPVRRILERVARRTDGALLEVKSGGVAFHYRATEPQLARRRLEELRAALEGDAQAGEFEVLEGRRVLEVRPRGVNKGAVVPELLASAPGATVLALGDDRTDEALFAALPPGAVAVHVGSGQSIARYRVSGVTAARALLKRVADTSRADRTPPPEALQASPSPG